MIWRWIYAPTGVLNTSLEAIGLGFLARGWLGDFTVVLPALAIASSWMTFGLSVVILLAGMQGIDPTLYDAARVDGAGPTRMFLDITIPSLRNTITIVILLALGLVAWMSSTGSDSETASSGPGTKSKTGSANASLPVYYQDAKEEGDLDQYDFGDDCDPANGRIKVPSLYAPPCAAPPRLAATSGAPKPSLSACTRLQARL